MVSPRQDVPVADDGKRGKGRVLGCGDLHKKKLQVRKKKSDQGRSKGGKEAEGEKR